MNETTSNRTNFLDIFNKSNRLAAAVFMVSDIIDQSEELKTKLKRLSLDMVSMSVKLKDINLYDAKKIMADLEKNSLELMSMLDIAALSGLISEMNGSVLKGEFKSFISELVKFSESFENDKNISVKSIFAEQVASNVAVLNNFEKNLLLEKTPIVDSQNNGKENGGKNNNGHKRKDLRKNAILGFIKGHNNASIKDIVPNITGCSEKTVQRELIELIKEGKIVKTGERRWSKYSIV